LVRRQTGDVDIAQPDTATRGLQHAGNGADQRCLAGAVGADDSDDGALRHFERHVVERPQVAVADFEVRDGQHQTASTPRYDSITAGSRTTVSGLPSVMAAPWSSTSTRPATDITARMTCSIS